MATISTHNGSAVRWAHNVRSESVVRKQAHIDPDGRHEIWHDEPIREMYARIFGDALQAYNERSRPDRQISDYYDHIRRDSKKHPCYEMIVGVYGDDVSDVQSEVILREYWQGWQKRNPNLIAVGAYYHADEEGRPHLHIDYVPVAHGFKRGLETQTGLVRALGEQGIIKHGRETAQMQWQSRENWELECFCMSRGLSVEHPQAGHGAKHAHTEAFKAEARLHALEAEETRIKQYLQEVQSHLQEVQENISYLQEKRLQVEQDLEIARIKQQEMPLQEHIKALMYDEMRRDRPELFDRTGNYISRAAMANRERTHARSR